MNGLLILLAILALLVVAVGWRFVHQIRRRQLVSGLVWSVQGVLVFAGFLVILLIYSNLHTYQRLTYEQVIADVYIRQLKPQRFQVSLSFSEQDRDQHYYELNGDQWQLDARILKWKGWANLLGLDSFYQLDRLSGRYADAEQARLAARSVFDLSAERAGLDIWRLKQIWRDKIGFVDTLFGQGVFMPMADGAHYQVSIGQQGLITRPVNDAARASAL